MKKKKLIAALAYVTFFGYFCCLGILSQQLAVLVISSWLYCNFHGLPLPATVPTCTCTVSFLGTWKIFYIRVQNNIPEIYIVCYVSKWKSQFSDLVTLHWLKKTLMASRENNYALLRKIKYYCWIHTFWQTKYLKFSILEKVLYSVKLKIVSTIVIDKNIQQSPLLNKHLSYSVAFLIHLVNRTMFYVIVWDISRVYTFGFALESENWGWNKIVQLTKNN